MARANGRDEQAADTATGSDAALVAELNDLLRLDHDAIAAYQLAAATIGSEAHRRTIELYRRDHERHVRELSELVRARGGTPAAGPHPAEGTFKLAMQAAGAAGGTRGVLLAFETNEVRSRDRYRKAANGRHPEDVALVLARAAQDEATHHAWAVEARRALDAEAADAVDDRTPAPVRAAASRAGRIANVVQARAADTLDDAREAAATAADRVSRVLPARVKRKPGLGALLLAAGIGFVVARLVARRR